METKENIHFSSRLLGLGQAFLGGAFLALGIEDFILIQESNLVDGGSKVLLGGIFIEKGYKSFTGNK